MDGPQPRTAAGGFPIAIGAIGGAMLGFAAGQPTIGVLIGTSIGVVIAVAIWLAGRR